MSTKASDPNGHPPENFLCPLTLDLMRNPVVDVSSGMSFERSAIIEWLFRGNNTCPLTRKSLHMDNLSTNSVLLKEINDWKKKCLVQTNNFEATYDSEDEEETKVEESVEDLAEVDSHLLAIRNRIICQRNRRLQSSSEDGHRECLRDEDREYLIRLRDRIYKRRDDKVAQIFRSHAA